MSTNTSLEGIQSAMEQNTSIAIALGEFGLIHAGTIEYLKQIIEQNNSTLFVAIFPNWDKENSKQLLRTDEKFRLIQMMENVKGVILLSEDLSELETIKQTAPEAQWYIHGNESSFASNLEKIQQQDIQPTQIETNQDCTTEDILQRMAIPAKS